MTITGEQTNGSAVSASYTAKFDGSASKVSGIGTPYDTIAIKQLDANTFTYDGTNAANKYHVTFRLVVAPGGKSMTSTGKGTDTTGAAIKLTLFLEKQ